MIKTASDQLDEVSIRLDWEGVQPRWLEVAKLRRDRMQYITLHDADVLTGLAHNDTFSGLRTKVVNQSIKVFQLELTLFNVVARCANYTVDLWHNSAAGRCPSSWVRALSPRSLYFAYLRVEILCQLGAADDINIDSLATWNRIFFFVKNALRNAIDDVHRHDPGHEWVSTTAARFWRDTLKEDHRLQPIGELMETHHICRIDGFHRLLGPPPYAMWKMALHSDEVTDLCHRIHGLTPDAARLQDITTAQQNLNHYLMCGAAILKIFDMYPESAQALVDLVSIVMGKGHDISTPLNRVIFLHDFAGQHLAKDRHLAERLFLTSTSGAPESLVCHYACGFDRCLSTAHVLGRLNEWMRGPNRKVVMFGLSEKQFDNPNRVMPIMVNAAVNSGAQLKRSNDPALTQHQCVGRVAWMDSPSMGAC